MRRKGSFVSLNCTARVQHIVMCISELLVLQLELCCNSLRQIPTLLFMTAFPGFTAMHTTCIWGTVFIKYAVCPNDQVFELIIQLRARDRDAFSNCCVPAQSSFVSAVQQYQ